MPLIHDTEHSREFPTQCFCGGDLQVVETRRLLPDDCTDSRSNCLQFETVKCVKCGTMRKRKRIFR